MRPSALAIAAALGCGNAAPPPSTPPSTAVAEPAPSATPPSDTAAAAIAALIGTTPPEWHAERWMNSAPLELAKLRGQVVMVRWWTAGCPFCSTTAPALRTFDQTYGPRGLRVVGMYHHKETTPFDPKVFEETARKYEFTFPVAVDPDWKTLRSWLHDAAGRKVDTGWTSVTFLLDKRGVIRHVHPGGSYVAGEPAYDEMRGAIEKLLAE